MPPASRRCSAGARRAGRRSAAPSRPGSRPRAPPLRRGASALPRVPVSPAVRSRIPARYPASTALSRVPAQVSSTSSRWAAMARMSTGIGRVVRTLRVKREKRKSEEGSEASSRFPLPLSLFPPTPSPVAATFARTRPGPSRARRSAPDTRATRSPPASTPTKLRQAARNASAIGLRPWVADDGRRLVQAHRERAELGAGLEIAQPALHPLDLLPHPRELPLDRQDVLQLAGPGPAAAPPAAPPAGARWRRGRPGPRTPRSRPRRHVHELAAGRSARSPSVSSSNRAGGHLDLQGGLAHLVPAALHGRRRRRSRRPAAPAAAAGPWPARANPPRCWPDRFG